MTYEDALEVMLIENGCCELDIINGEANENQYKFYVATNVVIKILEKKVRKKNLKLRFLSIFR